MINVNLNTTAVSNTTSTAAVSHTAAPAEVKNTNPMVNTGASAVVDLKTNVDKSEASSDVKVDASNARSMASDIAAMLLAGSNGKFQANLGGFDAARLLA